MDIQKQLVAVAKQAQLGFTLNGQPISLDDVFADSGLLPALAKRAEQLCSLCLGYGIGASFTEAKPEVSKVGKTVTFDSSTPSTLRLLCLLDVLMELKKYAPAGGAIPLDELMYDS